jgi:uncharacterized protein YndB with AHSA1/START domain
MDEKTTLIRPSTIRFERLLPGPIERVWEYLTLSEKRATWLAAGEFDLRVGGRIELIVDNDRLSDEKPPAGAIARGTKRIEGRITRLEAPWLLAHTWNWDGKETDVLYELTPKGKDVLLVIHHRVPDDQGLKVGFGGGWGAHTGILEDRLNGVKPRGFWSTHARLMNEFAATI